VASRRFAFAVLCVLLARASLATAAYVPDEAMVRGMNRAVGLMEQFRFTDAATAFDALAARAPTWAVAHLNAGIAHLNALSDPSKPGGALDKAEAAFRKAAELDPMMPNAPYCLGMLSRYRGDSTAALKYFQEALRLSPEDPDALYFIGTMLLSSGQMEASVDYFRRAIERNPYLLSAHYSLAQALIRLQERQEALSVLATFQRLDAAKVGVKRAVAYTEMGSLADVVRLFPPAKDAPRASKLAVRFTTTDAGLTLSHAGKGVPLAFAANDAASLGGSLGIGDVDGDEDLDIVAPAVRMTDGTVRDVLYVNANGRFRSQPLPNSRASSARDSVAALFGDYDGDGNADLYLLRSGPNALLRGDGKGSFADVTDAAGASGGDARSLAGAWSDADHDGDLDLLILNADGLALLRNNGNGSFADVTASSGLGDLPGNPWGLSLADFDNDADVDALIVPRSGSAQLRLNQRLNQWATGPSPSPFVSSAVSVLTADFDKDGDADVLALLGDSTPARLYRNRGDGSFEAYEWSDRVTGSTGALIDYDNDGAVDVFIANGKVGGEKSGHCVLLANDGAGRLTDVSNTVGLAGVVIANARGAAGVDIDSDGDSDLVIARNGDTPVVLRNDGANRHKWLSIRLAGKMANRLGYGSTVEVKCGSLWQKSELQMVGGVGASSSPRLEFGLADASTADFVRIVWSNAVLQSELEVAANQRLTIPEVQRKASSCPILFAWNGERFEFVTDFMGGGGIGFFVAPSAYGPPDPSERVRIEGSQLRERDGELQLRVMEPMEEVAYVDELRLTAVDHPVGTEVYPDERFSTDGQMPSGKPYVYERRIHPIRAIDQDGADWTETVTDRDRRYPTLDRHPRFLGYLARVHSLELDFGNRFSTLDASKPCVLNLYGWIEYPYSHVVYAAQQAGIEGSGMSVDVRTGGGDWRTVLTSAGYPAGMPKTMTLDISPYVTPDTQAIRLRTNMEIYIDEAFIAQDVGTDAVRQTQIRASRATLEHAGYPREASPDGRMPRLYDYSTMDRTYAFRNTRGVHTRYGDVTPVVADADDQYVILGRGEELAVAFSAADLPPIPEGYERTYLFDTFGYCKDMDLYTAFPDTVEPLPFRAMSGYPYASTESYPDTTAIRQYRATYQTREK